MKRTLLLITFLSFLGAWNYSANATTLEADPSIFIFYGGESQEAELNITSNTNWRINADVDWVDFNQTSGTGNATITLTVSEYPENIRRVGAISLEGDGGATPVGINVIQGDTIICTPGELSSIMSDNERYERERIVIKGSINAYDFYFIKGSMKSIDLRKAEIVEATGNIASPANTIPANAFQNDGKLEKIILPETCTTIGAYAFEECRIIEVVANEGLTNIYSAAFRNCYLRKINITESLTNISSSVFYRCRQLTGIVLPEGTEAINSYTYKNCSRLKAINIPASVTTMGRDAFNNCELDAIYAYPSTPIDISGVSSIFTNATYINATLYVPAGSLRAYEQAIGWSRFNHIEEMSAEFSLEQDEYNFSSASSSDQINITSTLYGFLATDADWVQLSRNNYLGDGNIGLSVKANPTANPRTATITVSVAGQPDEEITIHQSGTFTAIAKNKTTEADIKVYPNPVTDNLFIEAGSEKIEKIEIFDLTGKPQLIKEGPLDGDKIDLSGLKSGYYLVFVQTENDSTSLKIVKR